ncbi:MAG: hypothetical protein ACKESB_00830 [Candidatus Hodgkinia cicadicola]
MGTQVPVYTWQAFEGVQIAIAVNLNASVPIMSQADFGLVADMFEVIPKIMVKLTQLNYSPHQLPSPL